MHVKTVEPTVPSLRVPDVWPSFAPLPAGADRVTFFEALEPNTNPNGCLISGLQNNFTLAPLPEPDSPDLEIDAQELEETEHPGHITRTLAAAEEALSVAEELRRDGQSELQPELTEVAYQAAGLRKSLKRASTTAGEAKILWSSVVRGEDWSRLHGTSRRSSSAPAVSTRIRAQSTRISEKTGETALQSQKAVEQASSLGGMLRYLGAFARDQRKRWTISGLSQRLPSETQDLLSRLTSGLPVRR